MIRVGHTEVYDSDTGFKTYDLTAPSGYRVIDTGWCSTEDGHGTDAQYNGEIPIKNTVTGLYDTVRFRYFVNESHSEVSMFLLCEKVYDVDPNYEA